MEDDGMLLIMLSLFHKNRHSNLEIFIFIIIGF